MKTTTYITDSGATATLTAERKSDGEWSVTDESAGVWWATEGFALRLESLPRGQALEACLKACREWDPEEGEWYT